MGRKKLSMSEKIRRYVAQFPDAKPAEIAAALKCTADLVYVVRNTLRRGVKPKTNNVSSPKTAVVVTTEGLKELPIQMLEPVKPIATDTDMVNHPPHYTDGGIETIDFIAAKLTKEEFIGYLKGNAIKYGSRIGKKGSPDVDAGKMVWYAAKLREVLSPTL